MNLIDLSRHQQSAEAWINCLTAHFMQWKTVQGTVEFVLESVRYHKLNVLENGRVNEVSMGDTHFHAQGNG